MFGEVRDMGGRVLISGGTVVNATGTRATDILIENGRIAAVDTFYCS